VTLSKTLEESASEMNKKMEKLADEANPEIVHYDVESNDKLCFFMPDKTFVIYDLKDNKLKRISSKIYKKH